MNWEFIRQVGPIRWTTRTAIRQTTKRILRRDLTITLPTGPRLLLPRYSKFGTEVYITRANVDQGAEALFATFADPNRDFIDVGAHIGYYSLYLAPLVRTVYAVEPDKRVIPALRQNLAKNMHIIDVAASDQPGAARLNVDGDSGEIAQSGVMIRADTLDGLAAAHNIDAALVKIDAEGHDLAVLRGATHLLADSQPLVLTEFSPRASGTNDRQELYRLCRDHGYNVHAFAHPVGKSWKATLQPMPENSPLWAKMFFLVPPRLRGRFPGSG